MIAQVFNPEDQMGVDFGNGPETVPAQDSSAQNKPFGIQGEDDMSLMDSNSAESMEDKAPDDITEYISAKLQSFGYPPRRLDQYENEFVNEKIFPGQSREVTVVIPDRYYGQKKRLSTDDMSKMINEIQEQFGLEFVDADRVDLKLTMNFTSHGGRNGEEDEEVVVEDALTQVYGPASDESQLAKKKKKRTKAAATIQEMIKTNKDSLYDALVKSQEKI